MATTVSVLIPAHNGEATIGRAIETVLEQHVPDTEIIVIDDGSTDRTAEVVSRFCGVRLIRQERQGVAAARNVGLCAATGEFVAFLDCDDEWYAGKLQKQLAMFDDPELGVVSCGATSVDDQGRVRQLTPPNVRGWIAPILLYRNIIVTSSVVLRRACLAQVQPWFRKELSGRGAAIEDWELWVRLSGRFKFMVMSEPLVRYRLSPQSNSRQHLVDELKQLWRTAYAGLREDAVLGDEVARRWSGLQANIDFLAACRHYEAGRLWRARRAMLRSAVRAPLTPNWKSVLAVLFITPRVLRFLKARRS